MVIITIKKAVLNMSFTLFTFIFIFAVAGIFFVTPGIKKEPQELSNPEMVSIGSLTPKSEEYLNKIIEYIRNTDPEIPIIHR